MPLENAENQRSYEVFRRYRNENQSTDFFMMGGLIVSEVTHFMSLHTGTRCKIYSKLKIKIPELIDFLFPLKLSRNHTFHDNFRGYRN